MLKKRMTPLTTDSDTWTQKLMSDKLRIEPAVLVSMVESPAAFKSLTCGGAVSCGSIPPKGFDRLNFAPMDSLGFSVTPKTFSRAANRLFSETSALTSPEQAFLDNSIGLYA